MKVTVVTCTGGRPELFELCRRWVTRQTKQPDRWIVTTDFGDRPFAPEAEVLAIPAGYEQPYCPNPSPAQRALHYALSKVEDDSAVVVMEDDDWYAADYIERVLAPDPWAAHQSVVEMFHLPSQRRMEPTPYPSPVEGMLTFKAGSVGRVSEWLVSCPRPELGSFPIEPMRSTVQVKGVGYGLPGRAGATRKHITDHYKIRGMVKDPGHARFREVVGADADAYLSLLR